MGIDWGKLFEAGIEMLEDGISTQVEECKPIAEAFAREGMSMAEQAKQRNDKRREWAKYRAMNGGRKHPDEIAYERACALEDDDSSPDSPAPPQRAQIDIRQLPRSPKR